MKSMTALHCEILRCFLLTYTPSTLFLGNSCKNFLYHFLNLFSVCSCVEDVGANL